MYEMKCGMCTWRCMTATMADAIVEHAKHLAGNHANNASASPISSETLFDRALTFEDYQFLKGCGIKAFAK